MNRVMPADDQAVTVPTVLGSHSVPTVTILSHAARQRNDFCAFSGYFRSQ
jgi:hypothetical protein